MLENIANFYLLGCGAALLPTILIYLSHKQNDVRVPTVYYFMNIAFGWIFIVLFLFENFKKIIQQKKSFPRQQPTDIPKTADCSGFLNFSVKVRVESKNRFGGVNILLDQPLIYVLSQYMKDYGFKMDEIDENELRVVLRLPTGSEAIFPFATRQPTNGQ